MSNLNLTNLMQYIEANISDKLKANYISKAGYISRRKLYNDFYSASGHPVKEYVRKRRLSNALALIKTSELTLENIAWECGYPTRQALCRAIKQTLGITASEYKTGDSYYFFPPCGADVSLQITVAGETIPQTTCFQFYYPRLTGIENAALGQFFAQNPNFVGRIFGRNGKQTGQGFCYEIYPCEAGAAKSQATRPAHEVCERVYHTDDSITGIKKGVFATLTVKYDEAAINAAWDYLYKKWLQSSMFEHTNEPYFEEYIFRNGRPVKLKLYLPIQARSKDTRITLTANPKLRFITAAARGVNAEEKAAQTVIHYIKKHCPHILNQCNEMYVQKHNGSHICGVRVNDKIDKTRHTTDANIFITETTHNNYLLLESSTMGDYDKYAGLLLSFSKDNGMNIDEPGIFAVYDTSQSHTNPKIKMYAPVKLCTK